MLPVSQTYITKQQRLDSLLQKEGLSKTVAVFLNVISVASLGTAIAGLIIKAPYVILAGNVTFFVLTPIALGFCRSNMNNSKEKQELLGELTDSKLNEMLQKQTDDEELKNLIIAFSDKKRLHAILKLNEDESEKIIEALASLPEHFLNHILGLKQELIDQVLKKSDVEELLKILDQKFSEFNRLYDEKEFVEEDQIFIQAELFYKIAEQFGQPSNTLKITLATGLFAEENPVNLIDFTPIDSLFAEGSELYRIAFQSEHGKTFLKNWQSLKNYSK